MQWTPEYRDCPVCGSNKRKIVGQRGGKAHRANLGTESTVVKCRDCDLLYACPTLLPLGNPYDDSSFDDYFRHHPEESKIAAGEYLAKEAEKLSGRAGSVLEVGCGGGGVLQGFLSRGWRCAGVEMTKEFADVAEKRGLTVIRQSVETVEFTASYDVIIFPAIIEHLYDPLGVLTKCVGALNGGGFVHIEAPNESALSLTMGNVYNRLRGRDWTINLSPTFPPFHVVGFNPRSMKTLLEKAGLELVSLQITPYQTTLPENVPAFERLGMTLLQKLGGGIGRGDGLSVWARVGDR